MLRIQVNDTNLLDDLRDALGDAECSTAQLSGNTLLVTHPLAVDEAEAKLELEFFLRAWQARRPGAEAELLG
jgi:hypothetical protein